MFNFLKKRKAQKILAEAKEMKRKEEIAHEIRVKKEQELIELLDGKESYKIFSWGFGFKDGRILRDKFLPLKDWEPIEKVFTLLEKEYENIEDGSFMLKIKDDKPSYDGDEIASLQIQIKYGYMRPYMKYREEGAVYAEEWKEYDGGGDYRVYKDGKVLIENFEFGWDSVPIYNLTKDINLVKTIFKEFYETGDVSEEYMI